MMQDAIAQFSQQFTFAPEVRHAKKLKKRKRALVVGMGGSHLCADVLLGYDPAYPLQVRRDYGLPALPDSELRKHLIIASSYSGNTEEVIEAYNQARAKRLPLACIAVGGKLIAFAQRDGVPYVQLPDTGIQPRSALGLSLRALLKLLGEESLLQQTDRLAHVLRPNLLKRKGEALAKKLKGKVPVVYASSANETIAWNWKIKLNETGKIPAFYNVFPELNHNEMTGFDVQPKSKKLSTPFHFIVLKDTKDHPRIQKRMAVLEKLYKKRKLPLTTIELRGKDFFERAFSSLLLADWMSVATAELYGLESEQVPMVEEFKKMI